MENLMTNSSISSLVDPIQEHILPLLELALKAAAERHQLTLGRGSDNFSFGTDAWSLPSRVFRNAVGDGLVPFTVENHVACILGFGDYRIHHHRVGSTERDDITTSTPTSAEAAALATERQMNFEFISPDDDELPTTHTVVLAYMANPQDGLCAAYLATVGRVENGKIAEWGEVEQIWHREAGLMSISIALPKPEPPPAEQSRRPIVRLIELKATDADKT
jgi:hypothetical protein